MSSFLEKEDYTEPRCLICDIDPSSEQAHVQAVPVGRILEKLDAFLDRNDTESAKRHLLYWIEEAKAGHDARGQFTLTNEWMGLARKLGLRDEAIKARVRCGELSIHRAFCILWRKKNAWRLGGLS